MVFCQQEVKLKIWHVSNYQKINRLKCTESMFSHHASLPPPPLHLSHIYSTLMHLQACCITVGMKNRRLLLNETHPFYVKEEEKGESWWKKGEIPFFTGEDQAREKRRRRKKPRSALLAFGTMTLNLFFEKKSSNTRALKMSSDSSVSIIIHLWLANMKRLSSAVINNKIYYITRLQLIFSELFFPFLGISNS